MEAGRVRRRVEEGGQLALRPGPSRARVGQRGGHVERLALGPQAVEARGVAGGFALGEQLRQRL